MNDNTRNAPSPFASCWLNRVTVNLYQIINSNSPTTTISADLISVWNSGESADTSHWYSPVKVRSTSVSTTRFWSEAATCKECCDEIIFHEKYAFYNRVSSSFICRSASDRSVTRNLISFLRKQTFFIGLLYV